MSIQEPFGSLGPQRFFLNLQDSMSESDRSGEKHLVILSGADVLKVANLRLTGQEFQGFGDTLVRSLIKMAVVPEPEALGIDPVRDEPDLLSAVEGAEDFHPHKARLLIHQMRPITEGFLHLGDLVIGDHESAERDKRAGGLGGTPHRGHCAD